MRHAFRDRTTTGQFNPLTQECNLLQEELAERVSRGLGRGLELAVAEKHIEF